VAKGTLYSYLANENKFTGMVPITIPKGQLIKAAGMSVKLGGKVPANVDTGDLHVRFISDANGYLVLRPTSVPGGSGYNVFMTFDVAVTTANPKANAILNQDVLQVQAAGLATASGPNGNTISIETVGAMQLNLLNAGYATANFDFKFSAPSTNVLPTDTSAPTIQTTYPADGSDSFPAAASPSVVFSEPVTQSTAESDITLTDSTTSTSVPATVSVDGSTAVVTPNQPLTRGDKYQLNVTSGIQDYAGNPLASGQTTSFTVPAFNASPGNGAAPPLISAIYPGTPCALTGGNWQNGTGTSAGHCEGGKSTDDTFQVFQLPANRYIDVYFTKPIAPSSLTLATTCPKSGTPNGSILVEHLNSNGKCENVVSGTLEKTPEHVRFLPSDPWQAGWHYAVELRAGTEGSTTCGQNVICGSKNSLPLNPDPLAGGTSGGTNVAFKMPFDGAPAVHQSSYAPVALTPTTDQNGNGYYDTGSPAEQIREGNSAYAYIPSNSCSGLLCPVSITGPDQSNGKGGHIFLSNPLPARMLGPDSKGRIPVRLSPGVIYGTNLNMQASSLSVSASTGIAILRIRQIRIPINPDGSAGSPVKGEDPVGYITYQTDPSTGKKVPWMHAYMDVYMDTPDENVANGAGSTDLHSKAVGPIELAGPVKFDDDGQLDITLSNQQAIDIPVHAQASIPLLGGLVSADLTVQMPKGGMQVHYLGAPLKGRTKGRPQYD